MFILVENGARVKVFVDLWQDMQVLWCDDRIIGNSEISNLSTDISMSTPGSIEKSKIIFVALS